MNLIRLSYDMSPADPGWPGNATMQIEHVSRIAAGDAANLYNVSFLNHFGSHMDGPRHFNDNGPRLAEMPLATFVFEQPLLLDIPLSFGELLTPADLWPHEAAIAASDGLFIRSGFARYRRREGKRYASEGPGIGSDACRYIMDTFPRLKAVAMDWISLASNVHIEDGILAHQYLLGIHHNRYVCIIEDINLDGLLASTIKRIIALPLFTEEIDSAPVTVIAEVAE